MPSTTHGTVTPHLAALHIRGQPPRPYLSLPILCIQGPGANVVIPNSLALSLQAHNTSACSASSPHTTSPPTYPAPNSSLMDGVIRLPAGGSSQNLDPSMCSRTFNWSHTCNGAICPHCGLTWCRPGPKHWGQPQWPPIVAPQSTTTSSSQQMEPADPLPVKPLIPTLQEDLYCQGNHQVLVELQNTYK